MRQVETPPRGAARPSAAVQAMHRSGIREIFDAARDLPDVIHLEVGEPSFPTPSHIRRAAAEAAERGLTRYTPNAGIPELRVALANKVRLRNGFEPDPDHVIVTAGAVAGLFSALLCVAEPGDEVLLSDPSWPNFRMMCELQGLGVRYYPLRVDTGLQQSLPDIESLISARTRVLVINSPSNPTGAVIDEATLERVYELARRHNLWILSDEVYDAISFEEPAFSIARLDEDKRVITVFSFSKTHAMTGWRVGYVVAPAEIAPLVTHVQEALTSCVNAPAQAAALAAVTGPQDHVETMRAAYLVRRDKVLGLLQQGGVPACRPSGAFYVWVDISGSGLDDVAFTRRLLHEEEVAVVPGTTFGPSSRAFVRISLATAPEELLEGVSRLVSAHNRWAA